MHTVLWFTLLTTLAHGAKFDVEIRNPQGCVANFNPETEYFPDKASANYARDYQITYYNSFKVIMNNLSNETYIGYQCGTPVPGSDPRVPLPDDISTSVKFFSIPLTHGVALPETSVITLIELLGVSHSVEYVSEYYSSPCIAKAIDSGEMQIWNSTLTQMENSVAIFSWGSDASNPKHIDAGSLTSDPGTLNRAEWIKWISAFFNREALANALFQNVIDRYHCHKDKVAEFARPKMYWISYSTWPDSKPPRYIIETAPYINQFISDAGGFPPTLAKYEYAYGIDPETNETVDELTEWLEALKEADFIVDATYSTNDLDTFVSYYLFNQTENYQTVYKFIDNQQVYKFDNLRRSFGLDWYESSIPEPDVVLEDMIEMMHPNYQDHERVWFRNVAKGEESRIWQASECIVVEGSAALHANCCDETQDCQLEANVEVVSFKESDLSSSGTESISAFILGIVSLILFANCK